MCGRYVLGLTEEGLRALFSIDEAVPWSPRYNIAPTQLVPILRIGKSGAREATLARWGLIPSWAKDPSIGNRMINARVETLAEKPAYRAAFKSRRCVVPTTGFYEWQKVEGRAKGPKQPFVFERADGKPYLLAGLWEVGSSESGERVVTFTIVTTEAVPPVAEVHERMPLIVSREAVSVWLDPAVEGSVALARVHEAAPVLLSARPVSTRVNNPREDDADLVARVG